MLGCCAAPPAGARSQEQGSTSCRRITKTTAQQAGCKAEREQAAERRGDTVPTRKNVLTRWLNTYPNVTQKRSSEVTNSYRMDFVEHGQSDS